MLLIPHYFVVSYHLHFLRYETLFQFRHYHFQALSFVIEFPFQCSFFAYLNLPVFFLSITAIFL